ncbi:MAG: amylo-alpha-1,6-glucosidase [Verrucomicrobiota bacterium]
MCVVHALGMGFPLNQEWLVTDGLGGFGMGTVGGVRTRRYHSLWTHSLTPPSDRFLIWNGFQAGVVTDDGRYARLTSQKYAPDTLLPTENVELLDYTSHPFPTWKYRILNEIELTFSIWMERGKSGVHLDWTFSESRKDWTFWVIPFLSGRDFHSLHHANTERNLEVKESLQVWRLQPYANRPAYEMRSDGIFLRDPTWYYQFQYDEEKARGLEDVEDLHSPGVFQWDIVWNKAHLEFGLEGESRLIQPNPPKSGFEKTADDFLVKRGEGLTLIAGYPWFGDWGRDTFIAMRGLLLAQDRREESLSILLEWSKYVDRGMMPNRFPDEGAQPEYNSVDASLWYVVVVGEFLEKWASTLSKNESLMLQEACLAILKGYREGTRYGIQMDDDGLIACGEAGVQLTWMDAKVGDWVVTPRIGKPVEVQALWIHALMVGGRWEKSWEKMALKAAQSFQKRFWNGQSLNDLVDMNHQPGRVDDAIRPNMLLAIGGLPRMLISPEQAKKVLEIVEKQLWTSAGLRSLSPDHPDYKGKCEGGILQRDSAYHQGTVWVWWIGPFIEAWLRVYGESSEVKADLQNRFLKPLIQHLDPLNQNHLPEIADGDAPYESRGCPFQAWSLGEWMRVKKKLE